MAEVAEAAGTKVADEKAGDDEYFLRAENLKVTFRAPGGRKLHAVDTIDLGVRSRETVGLVGESGSGKSTVALTLMRAHEPESGRIWVDGQDITRLNYSELLPIRRKVQMVFQDPYSSLDPRMSIRRVIAEPLKAHKYGTRAQINRRVDELLEQVGLPPDSVTRVPSQFSGGQRQRIAVARALALEPLALIADEPVSSLDVSIQAQIINLLEDLQDQFGLTYLFISHDLRVVRHISNRVAVMYLGKIVEQADQDDLHANPLHPYSQALLSSVPVPNPAMVKDRKRVILKGDVPSPINPPSGCRFRTRCPIAQPSCADSLPLLREVKENHWVACHLV